MKKIAALLLILAISGCSQKKPSEQQPSNVAPVPSLSQEERDQLIAKATSGLKAHRDKMEKISFYENKKRSVLGDRLSTYISIPDSGNVAYLRIYPLYYGDSWVFFDKIKIMADDNVVYEKEFQRSEIHRDNGSNKVWESADYVARGYDIDALKKIASAQNVTIRFSGNDRREDFDLKKQEIENLKEMLQAYSALSPIYPHGLSK